MAIELSTLSAPDRDGIWAAINPIQTELTVQSIAGITTTIVSNSVITLRLASMKVPGDLVEPITYRRALSTEYTLPGVVTSLDGARWIFAEDKLLPEWFGAKGNATGAKGIGDDDVDAINDMFKTAAAIGAVACIPAGRKYRLAKAAQRPANETAIGPGFAGQLFYRSGSRILIEGVLFNDYFTATSTNITLLGYATADTTSGRPGRATSVHIEFGGEGRIEYSPELQGTSRGKMGVYIINTDDFSLKRARTSGAEFGSFNVTATMSTVGHIDGGLIGYPIPGDSMGEDGLHMISCQDVTVDNMIILSGDDSISLTQEGADKALTVNKTMRNIVFNNCLLKTFGAKCIKFHIDSITTGAVIEDITFNNCRGLAAGIASNLEIPSGNATVTMLVDGRYGVISGLRSGAAAATGATTIAIAAKTGSAETIVPGHSISFDGGVTRYTVVTGIANMGVGGNVTIAAPGLVAPVVANGNVNVYNDRSFIRRVYFNGCHFDNGALKPDETTFGGTGRGHSIYILDCEDVHFNDCSQKGSSRAKVCYERSSGSFNGAIYGDDELPIPTDWPTTLALNSFVSNGTNWRMTLKNTPALTSFVSYLTAQLAKTPDIQARPFIALSGMNNSIHNGQYIVVAADAANYTIDVEYRRTGTSNYGESSTNGIGKLGICKRPDIMLLGCKNKVKINATIDKPQGSSIVYLGVSNISSTSYNEPTTNPEIILDINGQTRGEVIRSQVAQKGYFSFKSRNTKSQSIAINILSSSQVAEAYHVIDEVYDYDAMADAFSGFARLISTVYNSDRIGTLRGRVSSKVTGRVTQTANSTTFLINGNVSAYGAGTYASINPTHLNLVSTGAPQPYSVMWDANTALFTVTTAAAAVANTVWWYTLAPTEPMYVVVLPPAANTATVLSTGMWNDSAPWSDTASWRDN